MFSAPSGQGFLLLEVRALVKHVGKWQGAALPLPEKGARAERGWTPSWLAAVQKRPSGWVPHAPGSGRCRYTRDGPS